MEIVTNYICRLCLKQCDNIEVIEETHHEVLNVLLVTLDLAITHEPVMCKICAENLQKCFAFKIAALYIEDKVYVNNLAPDICLFCKNSTKIGSFIFLNGEELDITLLKAMVEQYLPELNLHTIMTPIMCTTCHEFLQGNFAFINSCLLVEEQIRKYRESVGSNSKGQVELIDVVRFKVERDQSLCSSIVKIEENLCAARKQNSGNCFSNVKLENEAETMIVSGIVKVEALVDDEEGDKTVDRKIKIENFAECDVNYIHEEIDIKTLNEDIVTEELWKEEEIQLKEQNEDQIVDTISECIEEVVRKWGSYYKESTLSDDSLGTQCEDGSNNINCDDTEEKHSVNKELGKSTETGKGNNMVIKKWWINMATTDNNTSPQHPAFFSKSQLRAMITHTKVSGEKKYQCGVCRFVAKAKCSMNRHMLVHQDPAELTIYQCHECSFKTKRKSDLVHHMLFHKDPSQIPVYKCQHCPFATKMRNNLRLHLVQHKDSPGVTMFECHNCGYKTCHKKCIRNHVLSHSRPKPVPKLHKCDKCSYQTMKKGHLTNHVLIHMHPSEVTMYKCEFCAYESKRKGKCVRHMECHREPVQCGYCEFQSKYTESLNKHLRNVHDVKAARRKMDKKV